MVLGIWWAGPHAAGLLRLPVQGEEWSGLGGGERCVRAGNELGLGRRARLGIQIQECPFGHVPRWHPLHGTVRPALPLQPARRVGRAVYLLARAAAISFHLSWPSSVCCERPMDSA